MNVGSTVESLRERRTRVVVYVAVVVVLALVLGFQAAIAGGTTAPTAEDGRWTPPESVATATTNESGVSTDFGGNVVGIPITPTGSDRPMISQNSVFS